MRALLGALVAALVTAPAVSQQTQLLPCIDAAARTASFDTRLDDAIACNSENPSQVKAHWEENRCTSWCVLHSDKTSTCNTKSGRKSCVRPVPSNANDDDYTIDDYNYYLINFIRAHIPSYVFDDLSTRLKLINPDSKLTQTQSERKVLFLGIDTVMSLNDPLGAATRTIWSQPQVSFNEAACQALPRLHPDLLCLKLDDEEYQILSLRAARKSLETKELSPDTTAQIINSYVRIFDELFSDLHLDFQRPEPSSSADPIQFTPNPLSSPTSSSSSSPSKSPTTNNPTQSPTKNPSKSPTTNSPTQSPTKNPTKSPTTKSPTQSPSPSPTSYNCACCDYFMMPGNSAVDREWCSNNQGFVDCATFFNEKQFQVYEFDATVGITICYHNSPDSTYFEDGPYSSYPACDPYSWDASECPLPSR